MIYFIKDFSSIREIRNSICGNIYPTSDSECQDPLAMQVKMENYCSSEDSCAEKVCESVGKSLLSYEQCSEKPCNMARATLFSQSSPSCTSNSCMQDWYNDGSTYIVYSKISCTSMLKHFGNHFHFICTSTCFLII